VALIVLPGLKVIVSSDGAKSSLLGLHPELHQLGDRKLLVRKLQADYRRETLRRRFGVSIRPLLCHQGSASKRGQV